MHDNHLGRKGQIGQHEGQSKKTDISKQISTNFEMKVKIEKGKERKKKSAHDTSRIHFRNP
jgi:hypothetical protein